MNNKVNENKKSSLVLGMVAFAIIVAIIVVMFSISANKNGGSPVRPELEVAATEVATEAPKNDDNNDTSSSSSDDTTDEEPVEDEEPAEDEEPVEDEEPADEEGIVECPNCNTMVASLEKFNPTEDSEFKKLWCADCHAGVEDGSITVDDIDFSGDVDCDDCGETFSKVGDKNSIKNNGVCDDCYQSYKTTMQENGVEVY